jgi:hypothetical protein
MFIVTKAINNGYMIASRKVAEFATYEEAKAFVFNTYAIEVFEEDPDHAGCADFFTKAMDTGAINAA